MMKKMVCLLMALLMMVGVCASAEGYVLGPFGFDVPVALTAGRFALQLEGEGMSVELSNLTAMSLPRAYAEMMEPADLQTMVQELHKSTFEDAEAFELDGGVYGVRYTDGEVRVANFICGMDMLYVKGPAGEATDALMDAVAEKLTYNADAEPVDVVLPLGSFRISVPEDWYVCSVTEKMAEFAPPQGSVGVQLASAGKMGVDQAAVESMGLEAANAKVVEGLMEGFPGSEEFVTAAGLPAVRCWQKVSDKASVLMVFVVNGEDVAMMISSANAGEEVMQQMADALLAGIAAE